MLSVSHRALCATASLVVLLLSSLLHYYVIPPYLSTYLGSRNPRPAKRPAKTPFPSPHTQDLPKRYTFPSFFQRVFEIDFWPENDTQGSQKGCPNEVKIMKIHEKLRSGAEVAFRSFFFSIYHKKVEKSKEKLSKIPLTVMD